MVRAVICKRHSFVASIRREHQPQPSPALGRSGAGCRKIAHPAPHGPTLDQQRQAAFLRKSLLFKESALSLAVFPLAVKTALKNDGWRKKAGGLGACFASFLPGNERFEGIGDLLLLMP